MCPIESEYKYYGSTAKNFPWKRDSWNDLKISFGRLDEKKYSNEVRVWGNEKE